MPNRRGGAPIAPSPRSRCVMRAGGASEVSGFSALIECPARLYSDCHRESLVPRATMTRFLTITAALLFVFVSATTEDESCFNTGDCFISEASILAPCVEKCLVNVSYYSFPDA